MRKARSASASNVSGSSSSSYISVLAMVAVSFHVGVGSVESGATTLIAPALGRHPATSAAFPISTGGKMGNSETPPGGGGVRVAATIGLGVHRALAERQHL